VVRKDPLFTVLKLAQDAEKQAAQQLKSAQLALQKSQAQMDALRHYRLDYMKQMKSHQGKQVSANYYHQFHKFVEQIDEAITKQYVSLNEADSQRMHRQLHWQQQQQKRKSIELLLDKKAIQAQLAELRQEQKISDEFASLQFSRRRSSP